MKSSRKAIVILFVVFIITITYGLSMVNESVVNEVLSKRVHRVTFEKPSSRVFELTNKTDKQTAYNITTKIIENSNPEYNYTVTYSVGTKILYNSELNDEINIIFNSEMDETILLKETITLNHRVDDVVDIELFSDIKEEDYQKESVFDSNIIKSLFGLIGIISVFFVIRKGKTVKE